MRSTFARSLRLAARLAPGLGIVAHCNFHPNASHAVTPVTPNLVIVDSSFPPVKAGGFAFGSGTCLVIHEGGAVEGERGPCLDEKLWKDVTPADVTLLKGLQDALAGRTTELATQWKAVEASRPDDAKRVKGNYLWAAHGSRAAYVAWVHSGKRAVPLAVRNLSSQGGGGFGSGIAATPPARPKYPNGCGLVNWTAADLKSFETGALQDYQERLSKTLAAGSARVVNLSLGYKRTWIGEDSPGCTPAQVDKEYQVLQASWRALLAKHPNVLFVVAAGNDGEDLDNPNFGPNDLWASLAEWAPNLAVVGSYTEATGVRLASTNFGTPVRPFAPGDAIAVVSPLPGVEAGYPTTLRGTSFSAPIVAGEAVALLQKEPDLTASALRDRLIQKLAEARSKRLFDFYAKSCSGGLKEPQDCLNAIGNLFREDFVWENARGDFLEGKRDWEFAPFPIQFDPGLKAQAQLKMVELEGKYLPGLMLAPASDPWEMLITLRHEVHHYATMKEAARFFTVNEKKDNCITPYQLALLNDEAPAFTREIAFWENAPAWFKAKFKGKKVESRLLGKTLNHDALYAELKAALAADPKFVAKRYVELGEYPECAKKLL